ncbi:site-specific integrase [Rhizobium halophilum]|uniref:integrase n=1 Tax=Rhizobium halophilum TaxID=2846852 RepID=UPI001EFEDF73|nr:integrase [Rhizobium halophilum]MCF6370986.1 integrase [Rhizobium halophilum]
MPAKHRHLLDRDGRFFARIVIPKDLRPFLDNKHELREPLGPDRRTAIARLATAVAGLQARIAVAERKARLAKGEAVRPGRYLLPVNEIVLRRYNDQLAFDSEIRNSDARYANMEPDDSLIPVYRDGIAGKLSDESLRMLLGDVIERYRGLGNTTAEFGTTEWRTLAQALCVAELEILGRVMERHEGDFTGKPEHPVLVKAIESDPVAAEVSESEYNRLTFSEIIEEQERVTKMGLGGFEKSEATLKKYRQTVYDFERFRRSKYAATVTLEEGEAWRNAMLAEGKLSRKTIRDKLASIRAILAWGQKQCRGKLFPNTPSKTPFEFLEMPNAEVKDSAERTYSLKDARHFLEFARTATRASFRWIPWIIAHTGARVNEITPLEKRDVFEVEGHWFIHIRVGGGRTTKTRKARKIPVHKALVAEGFLDWVKSQPDGRLFPGHKDQDNNLREWIHEKVFPGRNDLPPPNHGFRHLFEDALFADVSHKAALYITGRSSGSSADDYGGSDLRLIEIAKQMEKVRDIL